MITMLHLQHDIAAGTYHVKLEKKYEYEYFLCTKKRYLLQPQLYVVFFTFFTLFCNESFSEPWAVPLAGRQLFNMRARQFLQNCLVLLCITGIFIPDTVFRASKHLC